MEERRTRIGYVDPPSKMARSEQIMEHRQYRQLLIGVVEAELLANPLKNAAGLEAGAITDFIK
jgi:hypothetical protein